MARPICLRLLVHWARRAASRADCTAGRSRLMRTAMMAITTSNSIRVKPRALGRRESDLRMRRRSLGEGRHETRLAPVQTNQKRDESETTIDFRHSRVDRNIGDLLGWK